MPGATLASEQCGDNFKKICFFDALRLSITRLPDGRKRIWHVRRDHEMLLGICVRDVLKFPILLVFTSAAKHRHSWFPRWLISKMNGVVATTPEAGSYVPNTTKIVPHGISLKRFSPPKDKATAWQKTGLPGKYGIGVFGRVRPDKGTDIYVDAMIELLPKFPDYTAVIAGLCQSQYSEFKQILLNKIRDHSLFDRILFLDEIPPDKIAELYQNILITVACPRYEPFGLTPLEGMACGCAVVATDTGAFKTIVEEGVTGYVVPTEDVSALVKALKILMGDPNRTIKIGQAGRDRVTASFSVEKEAQGIREVYEIVWEKDKFK